MGKTRGFTLVELLVVMVASAVVITASSCMYAFIMQRVAADAAESSLHLQADSLDQEFQRVLQISTSATIVTVNGASCLKCAIPAGGTDENLDNVVDNAVPSSVSAAGINTYTANQWVWFYMGDATGAPSATGTQLWRAVLSSSGTTPSNLNKDSSWSLQNGNPRFKLLESFAATCNATAETTTVTCTFSSLTRADRVGTSESMTNEVTRIAISRTYFWGDPR